LDALERLRGVHLTAEIGPAPRLVHQAAANALLDITGADTVLVSALVDENVFAAAEHAVRGRWGEAFPGIELPHAVLQ
jgi:hypothetical protein